MPQISLQSQLTQIFRLLCYRSSGVLLTPTVLPDWPTLTYKVTVPLYSYYHKSDFMFADRDTTPKSLAFDMQVHLPRAAHLHFEVDSFGNFLVHPTSAYLERLKEETVEGGRLRHLLSEQYSSLVTAGPEHICLVYTCSGVGGTEHRMHQFLDSILLKHSLLESNRISVVNWIPEKLSRKSLSSLAVRKQMDRSFPPGVAPSLTVCNELHKVYSNLSPSNLSYSNLWECLKGNHFTKLYVACERHEVVEYEGMLQGYPLHLLPFGGVHSAMSRQDTLSMSMRVSRETPLGPGTPSYPKDAPRMGQVETLLALSDQLGADHIDAAYRIARTLSKLEAESLPHSIRTALATVDQITSYTAEINQVRSTSQYP